MSGKSVYPVILCGGSGSRLWPLSRKSYPKQFTPLLGTTSLFQQSVRRLSGPGFEAPLVVTGEGFRFIVTEQLVEAGSTDSTVLIEPEGRNTAPAILAAALHLVARDPEAVLLVAPSDHVIPDDKAFQAAVMVGLEAANDGGLVTFGIQPTRPETGYGYLEMASSPSADVMPLVRFVEKPDAAKAMAMLAEGRFLWNAGIFLFRASAVVDAFEAYAPEMLPPVRAALAGAEPDLDFLRLAAAPWVTLPDISIDYAVMEKSDRLSVVPYTGAWSDLGAWNAVLDASEKDEFGVSTSGAALAIDCENTLLRAEAPNQRLVGLGLKDIVAVAMGDAVLVADLDSAQDVKNVVAQLKAEKVPQAETFPRDHRPWGWFESLVVGNRFQVKRIVVKPGGVLSLQSHVHRSEHWIVVEGTAKVTIDKSVKLVTENQSVYIPVGAVHRMENPGKLPMVLIEVQTGAYLGEDDITRFEDMYSRS